MPSTQPPNDYLAPSVPEEDKLLNQVHALRTRIAGARVREKVENDAQIALARKEADWDANVAAMSTQEHFPDLHYDALSERSKSYGKDRSIAHPPPDIPAAGASSGWSQRDKGSNPSRTIVVKLPGSKTKANNAAPTGETFHH